MVYEGQQRVAEGQGGLDACRVVYDAEALGALSGLERATNLYPDAPQEVVAALQPPMT